MGFSNDVSPCPSLIQRLHWYLRLPLDPLLARGIWWPSTTCHRHSRLDQDIWGPLAAQDGSGSLQKLGPKNSARSDLSKIRPQNMEKYSIIQFVLVFHAHNAHSIQMPNKINAHGKLRHVWRSLLMVNGWYGSLKACLRTPAICDGRIRFPRYQKTMLIGESAESSSGLFQLIGEYLGHCCRISLEQHISGRTGTECVRASRVTAT